MRRWKFIKGITIALQGNNIDMEEILLANVKKISKAPLAREVWLFYFNDVLFERKLITEKEWRNMRRLINEKGKANGV